MDSQRNILLIALALVSFLLFQQWQVAKNPAPQAVEQAQSSSTLPAPSFVMSWTQFLVNSKLLQKLSQ